MHELLDTSNVRLETGEHELVKTIDIRLVVD